ncbi:MAG: hypothetical protein CMD02_07600 [Flavobacteriales bacterium]|nr:hypothetical protein [Flavobacteriales bacterium]|tara:strand:+ start:11391 stop:12668 length:1278 start_codon:yes stop_codon:yes gene_type:complete
MKFRKALKSDSVKDFLSLFFSNILQKIFGLVREPVVAFFFGSSLLYANYLLLRTIADFFSQFTVGNALKANLLPKFTKVFEKYHDVSFKKIKIFSKKTMILLFILSQIIQFIIIWYLDCDYTTKLKLVIVSILLSISICFNFLNTIYLTIMQAEAKFYSYSLATTLNSFLVAVFIYPLTFFFKVFGLVVSRLIGILSLTIVYVIPMNKKKDGYEIPISREDLNFPTLILGNFANIIIISSRLVSGLDGGVSITYYTYSVFILNAVLTAIIGNISTLLLRKVSIRKNSMFMLYSLLISVFVGIGLIFCLEFYGYELIKMIYMRGKFNLEDVQKTTQYIQHLSYAFVLIFISTTLFQPFFSLPIESSRKVRRNISFIFIFSILFGFICSLFTHYSVITESLIMIYSTTLVSLILSVFSYNYYLKNNK